MSTSPSSHSTPTMPSPRRRKRKFIFTRPMQLLTLAIIVLACANVVFLTAFWSFTQSKEIEDAEGSAGYSQADLSTPVAELDISQRVKPNPLIFPLTLPQSDYPPAGWVSPQPIPASKPMTTVTPRVIESPLSPAIEPELPAAQPEPIAAAPAIEPELPAAQPEPIAAAPAIEPELPAAQPEPITAAPAIEPELPAAQPEPIAAAPAIEPELSAVLPADAPPAAAPVNSTFQHVVIISVDGMRPDALAAADAPNMDALIARGSFSPNAQTIKTSITLPSHASMLSGVIEEKHGILWDEPYIGWPGMTGPTLFNIAHDAGLSTAMVYGKPRLNYLVLPNSVDQVFGQDAHDPEIRDHALEMIEAGLPNVLFIHFPDTDRVGHAYGWMSENQLYAVQYVDGLIGEIVAALEKGGYMDSTLLIVTADHGGHGKAHGDDSPLDRTIPWLAVGPGVPQGVTLTSPINIYDTAATTLHALNLPLPERMDGKPVLEIFQP